MELVLDLQGACVRGGVFECSRNNSGVMGLSIESHFQENIFDYVIPMVGGAT